MLGAGVDGGERVSDEANAAANCFAPNSAHNILAHAILSPLQGQTFQQCDAGASHVAMGPLSLPLPIVRGLGRRRPVTASRRK